MTTICVCGAGTMGGGIAYVSAAAGFSTLLFDAHPPALEAAEARLKADAAALVKKGKLATADAEALLGRLRFTGNATDCVADVVIEAIVEKMDVKTELFTRLASINPPTTVFASNTSSLSIAALAAALPAPERVAGLHFFNPAPLMKLVEVVRGPQTSPAVLDQLVTLTKALGKVPVVCTDSPGFVVNRVARPYYIEALRLAEEGMDLALIDRLLEDRGFRMGPFKLMDLIGNDVNYAVSTSVYEQLGRPERLRPSPLQAQKVTDGHLGRKTGKGYFDYH